MTVRIHVDGTVHEVEADGRNLLEVCLSLGYDLPYFCWHPAMDSVGACRQCAVKQYRDEDDEQGKLVMACMTGVEDGMRVSLDAAADFRAHVVEWLMVNHPHDCPVCDEGGECHLQDMTVMTGHSRRRYRFDKRTYRNQDLGPFVRHEMNRCIQCYRCVRFYRDHAGGVDLNVFAAHDHVYFGRHEDGTLESVLSGNLVEVCPTGVFTDKPLGARYTRKWDLRTAPSVCPHCSLGCNVTPGERHGEVRRVRNRYHHEVNGYFLCDRGRYGYDFVNSERRLRSPMAPHGANEPAEALDLDAALERAAAMLRDDGPVVGVGSARASLEANHALRTLVGPESFHAGVEPVLQRCAERAVELLRGPVRSASLADLRGADAVLVLGEDVARTAPLAALAVRRAGENAPLRAARDSGIPQWHAAALREHVQDDRGPVYTLTPFASELDPIARGPYHAPPETLARIGFAVAHELDDDEPAVEDLSDDDRELVRAIARDLAAADEPAVISGSSCAEPALQEAATRIAVALGRRRGRPALLALVQGEANSTGLALLGARPFDTLLERMEAGEIAGLVVLECDLFRLGSRERVRRALEATGRIVVVDHVAHETAAMADVVLPAATWAEATGTFVSSEGRAQRFVQVFPPEGAVRASWRWLVAMAHVTGRDDMPWITVEEVVGSASDAFPRLKGLADLETPLPDGEHVPRALHRYSGRTAMHADEDVRETPPPVDPDTPRSFGMEGFAPGATAAQQPEVWAPGWNSVQALNRFQEEIGGPMRGGERGRRLFEPHESAPSAEVDVPAPFVARDDGLRVLRRVETFGAEELSAMAPAVVERADEPAVYVSPDDAARLACDEGDALTLTLDGHDVTLPVRLDASLMPGTLALPVHRPGLPPPSTWPDFVAPRKEAR